MTLSKESTIKQFQKEIHRLAVAKGWFDGPPRNIPEMLALIHSEISEALEDWRKDDSGKEIFLEKHGNRISLSNVTTGAVYEKEGWKPVGFAIELADAVIRIMDLCEHLGIDLAQAIIVKHAFNCTREYRHGNLKA
jgi:NTP pyrophosphatase (non-canonical NTP hydrolase)